MRTGSKSLDLLIQNLMTSIEKEGKLTPLRAGEIVQTAGISETDLMAYADFDHPIEDCYGRKLVYDNGNFEIMVMSWNPDHYSSIHNHGYTQWGVVQVFGNAHHLIYSIKDEELRFAKKEVLSKGGVVKVNNKFIHQMGNASSDSYLSLHVYGCNDRNENITADAKNYDLEFDRISHTTGGAFLNLPESEIYDFKKGPRPTKEVLLHYAHVLLNYYNRQKQTLEIRALQENILSKLENRVLNKSVAIEELIRNKAAELTKEEYLS